MAFIGVNEVLIVLAVLALLFLLPKLLPKLASRISGMKDDYTHALKESKEELKD